MLFFILLSGVRETNPLGQFYFFEFDTSGITGATTDIPNPVRWTPYNYCGVSDSGRNTNCSPRRAAFPFQPQNAFGTTNGIPSDILDNSSTYYYLSRISYGFYIVALAFTVFSLGLAAIGCCSRLASAVASFFSFVGLLFVAAASAMITATYVMARNAFSDSGVSSSLGVKMLAFTWTITACLLLSFLLLCCSCVLGRRDATTRGTSGRRGGKSFFGLGGRRRSNVAGDGSSGQHVLNPESSFERTYESTEKQPRKKSGRGFFHVSRTNHNDNIATDPVEPSYYTEPHAGDRNLQQSGVITSTH